MIVYATAGWYEAVRRFQRWWDQHPWRRHPWAAAADAERYRRQAELLELRQKAIRDQQADQRARLRRLELRLRVLAAAAGGSGNADGTGVGGGAG